MKADVLRAALAGGLLAAGIISCSLTRSLDYLQSGGADGGAVRTPVVVANNQLAPRLLVQDRDALYWVTGDGAILSAPKTGGDTAPRSVATIGPGARFLAADADDGRMLFYASGTQVFSVPKEGGTPTPIATTDPPPLALAVDAVSVFVIASDPDSSETAGLYRFGRDGSGRTLLRTADDTLEMYALALDRDHVFWDEGDDRFLSLPKTAEAGAGAIEVFAAQSQDVESAIGPQAFAVDDGALYYSDGSSVRSLLRIDVSTPTTLITTGDDAESLAAIAIDGTHVYAVDSRVSGTLLRNVKNGRGTPERLLADLWKPNAVAVDATAVYLTVEGPPGAVLKVEK